MDANGIVQRIYSIKVEGYNDSSKTIELLTHKFKLLDEAKKRTDEQLAKAVSVGNSDAIPKLTKAIADLSSKLDFLQQEYDRTIKQHALFYDEQTIAANGYSKETTAAGNLTSQLEKLNAVKDKGAAAPVAAPVAINQPAPLHATINSSFDAQVTVAETHIDNLRTKLQELESEYTSLSSSTVNYEQRQSELQAKIASTRQEIETYTASLAENEAVSTSTNTEAVNRNVTAFEQLNLQYKDARKNAEAMAAEFGLESEQAIQAAQSAQVLKERIAEIKAFVNNGGISQTTNESLQVVSTDNLAELNQERNRTIQNNAEAVNELERAEAAAANSATAWAASQKEAEVVVKQTAEAIEEVVTPYQAYTGSLSENIKQNLVYKTRLSEINSELKALSTQYKTNQISLSAYEKSMAVLVEEQTFLKRASADLSQTISAQTKFIQSAESSYDQLNARLLIARNLMTQLSQEEKSSPFGQQLARDITVADAELKAFDAQLGKHQREVGNYGNAVSGAFSKAYGFIRQAANILPGIGIAGLFGLLYEGVSKIATKFYDWVTGTNAAKDAALLYKEVIEEINQIAIKNSTADITKLELLRKILSDTTKDQKTRNEALKEYNSIADAANKIDTSQINNLNVINDKISSQIDLIQKRGLARAAETIIAQRAEKLLLAQETANDKIRAEVQKEEDASVQLNKGVKLVPDASKTKSLQVGEKIQVYNLKTKRLEEVLVTQENISQFKSEADKSQKNIQQVDRESRIRKRVADDPEVQKAQQELDAAANAFKDKIANSFVSSVTNEKVVKATVDKLSVAEQNALKEIEAIHRQQLAEENTSYNEILKVRKATFDEEKEHLQRLEKIDIDALNKKIALLSQKKNLNAEEKAVLAQFQEQISSTQLQTSQKIQELEKKRFAEQNTELKEQLESSVQQIKIANQEIQDDVNASAQEKAQAKLDADNAILLAEITYYQKLKKLNSDYNREALAELKKQIEAQKALIGKDNKELSLSVLTTIQEVTDKSLAEIRLKYDKLKTDVLKSNKSNSDKQAAVTTLEKVENVEVSATNLDGLNQQVAAAKKLYDAGLITLQQYEAIYKKAQKGQQDLNNAIQAGKEQITSFGSLAQSALSKLFGFAEGSDKAKLLGQTITDAFATAQNAMNTFYDAEQQRIQQSLRAQEKRIDAEKEITLAGAQSQAERDSIEKRFAAQKEAAERQAFEKNKKLQKEQAKINLAMQLSNLAVIAFSPNPLNIATLGVAGTIMYALQSALALANYALNVSRINSAQFAYGGDVPSRGGRFGGKPHSDGGTPFRYKDNDFEAEVDELAVIRTRNAPKDKVFTVTGNQRQIASAANRIGGGVDFHPGATVKKFGNGGVVPSHGNMKFADGGLLPSYGGLTFGSSLQAPLNPSLFLSGNRTSGEDLTELKKMVTDVANTVGALAVQTNQRIDKIKVINDPVEAKFAENKYVTAQQVGTV